MLKNQFSKGFFDGFFEFFIPSRRLLIVVTSPFGGGRVGVIGESKLKKFRPKINGSLFLDNVYY